MEVERVSWLTGKSTQVYWIQVTNGTSKHTTEDPPTLNIKSEFVARNIITDLIARNIADQEAIISRILPVTTMAIRSAWTDGWDPSVIHVSNLFPLILSWSGRTFGYSYSTFFQYLNVGMQ